MGMSLRGFRGRNLETTVVASQRGIVRLHQNTAAGRFGRGGKLIAGRGFVDFHGCVCGSGRMICFDAKQSAKSAGLYFTAFKPHQLELILLFGTAGAVSGALAEYTGPDRNAHPDDLGARARRGFYWIDWKTLAHFRAVAPVIPWHRMTYLGGPGENIRFENVPGVREISA